MTRCLNRERRSVTALRQVYGSALLNSPFSIILGHSRGMVGISIPAGLNAISAIQEVGIAVAVEPIATVMDYSEFETV